MGLRGVTGQELQALAAPATAHDPPLVPAPRDGSAGEARSAGAITEAWTSQAVSASREAAPLNIPVAQRGGTRLHVDPPSKRIVAQILDRNLEVIKQIPPEEMLKIIARMRDMRGKLFDQSV